MVRDCLGNRLEPALEPAIERVVIAALVMRLMRLPDDSGWSGAKDPEPAAAVTPAIRHVGIETEVVPACGKIIPIGEAGFVEQPPHFRRANKSEAVSTHCVSNRRKQF